MNTIELNKRDLRDIQRHFNMFIDSLNKRIEFDGAELSDEDLSLLKDSILNSLKIAKIINKQKFTPKKYRK